MREPRNSQTPKELKIVSGTGKAWCYREKDYWDTYVEFESDEIGRKLINVHVPIPRANPTNR
jgi:hypothetical protein